MAKNRPTPPAATSVAERPRYIEPDIPLPDVPQYADSSQPLPEPDLAEIQAIARDASYLLLDERAQEWQLLAHGILGGAVIRTFSDFNEGVRFVKAAGITNCRCLKVPGGVIR